MSTDELKKCLGQRAAMLVEDGMFLGLGTGTTAACFVQSLAKRCHEEGLNVHLIASSEATAKLAISLGLKMSSQEPTSLDLVVDGADKIDQQKRVVKGLGGALMREKVLAHAAKDIVFMIDEQKYVASLENFILPLEILPFSWQMTQKSLQDQGYAPKVRKNLDGSFFLTDNQNFIFDLAFARTCVDPKYEQAKLLNIPGVLETGFFVDLPAQVMIASSNGDISIL